MADAWPGAGLLDHERSPSPTPSRNRRSNGRCKVLIVLIFFATTSCLVFALYFSDFSRKPPQIVEPVELIQAPKPAYNEVIVDNTTLSTRLHPEDHVSRPPTTHHHHWRITSAFRRPDGVLKRVYLTNDAFPGPTIEACSGDVLSITVQNRLSDNEGLSLHWHGLSMRGANDMDGATGITNLPIPAGESLVHVFKIENGQHGTFWWHAHDGVQRADGLYGGLVVHQPKQEAESNDQVEEEQLLMIGDWYHRPAKDVLKWYMRPGSFGNEPIPDSMLVNGWGAFNCSDAVPARPLDCRLVYREAMHKLHLDCSKNTRLRIVNTGAYAGFDVRIPGARLTVLAVDGGNKVSGTAAESVGTLWPGQRMDIILEPQAVMSSDAALEVAFETKPFKMRNFALTSTQQFPISWSGTLPRNDMLKRAETEHFDINSAYSASDQSNLMPESADLQIVLYTTTQKLAHLDNVPLGFINHTSWAPQSSPAGHLMALDREQWDSNQLVPYIPYKSSDPLWVDIILNNLDEEGHPFHLHGYDFWVLGEYSSTTNWGSWNPFENDVSPGGALDLVNAVKRDTVYIPRRGYSVLRLHADNEGMWMFHCHVLWHLGSGMAMAFDIR